MSIEDHPTARAIRAQQSGPGGGPRPSTTTLTVSAKALDAAELRALCLECGAEDAGFIPISEPLIAHERAGIETAFPGVRSLIGIVCRMPLENVRSPMRSVANQTFHTTGHEVDETCRRIVLALMDKGVKACHPSMAFPMEITNIPEEKAWLVSHKLVAEAAGLGVRGIHRSVIHPKFGSFVLLGTVLIDREVTPYAAKLDYNPCVECKLCVAACPVGAIKSDGHFDVSACMTHNYREFLGGFVDWVKTVTDSPTAAAYQDRVDDRETLSMWQSLAYGPNYKAAYCLAVCPAGEDVLGGFLDRRPAHIKGVLKPLQEKIEPLYVVRGSDAAAHAKQRYPHKRLRYVHSGIKPTNVPSFLHGLTWLFQRDASKGLAATYHFKFRGIEQAEATIEIRDQRIEVKPGLHGTPDVTISADSRAWIKFVRRERSLARLLLTGALRISPLPKGAALLEAFGKCFPS